MKHLSLLAAASVLTLAACTTAPAEAPEVAEEATTEVVETVETEKEEIVEEVAEEIVEAPEEVVEVVETISSADALASVLEGQPDEVKARYGARHPAETLAFIGVEPGMTVVEALPRRWLVFQDSDRLSRCRRNSDWRAISSSRL